MAELTGPADRRREVEHLAVPDRGVAAGPSVAPEGERHDGPVPGEHVHHPSNMRTINVAREAVGDDDGEVAGGWSSGVVGGVVYDGLPVVYGLDIHPVVSA